MKVSDRLGNNSLEQIGHIQKGNYHYITFIFIFYFFPPKVVSQV